MLEEEALRTPKILHAAEELAGAAEKLGKCRAADAGKPSHKDCARCAVKTAVQKYREACKPL